MAKPNAPAGPRDAVKPGPAPSEAKAPEAVASPAGRTEERVASESKAPATPRLRPVDLIEKAKGQLKELTGYPIDSVSEFGRVEDGWRMTITVIELSRIPPSTDVLAEYVVGLDRTGDIIDYRRGRRYFRDQVGEST